MSQYAELRYGMISEDESLDQTLDRLSALRQVRNLINQEEDWGITCEVKRSESSLDPLTYVARITEIRDGKLEAGIRQFITGAGLPTWFGLESDYKVCKRVVEGFNAKLRHPKGPTEVFGYVVETK